MSTDNRSLDGMVCADLTRKVNISKLRGRQPNQIAKALQKLDADNLRKQGYAWFRMTAPADDEDWCYLEAWKAKPAHEGKLDRSKAEEVK